MLHLHIENPEYIYDKRDIIQLQLLNLDRYMLSKLNGSWVTRGILEITQQPLSELLACMNVPVLISNDLEIVCCIFKVNIIISPECHIFFPLANFGHHTKIWGEFVCCLSVFSVHTNFHRQTSLGASLKECH